jgi:Glycosyl transferases group 1
MKILVWHVHGSWLTSFVQGPHDYVVPVTPARGPYGLGRARTWDWPSSVTEAVPCRLREAGIDLVLLQRPEEFGLASHWLGQVPGVDIPAVFVEHDPPPGPSAGTRHPMADVPGVRIVHVTRFNAAYWDCGRSPVTVVEHGIVDPGARWTGEIKRAGVAVNDPLRRGRVAGTDLLPGFAAAAPLDVFGMRVTGLAAALGLAPERCAEFEDLPQHRMHAELARRGVYVHPFRWTSLGLTLIEAMQLAMPVVVLAATEAPVAVPPAAGHISTSITELHDAVRRLLRDRPAAAAAGAAARQAACARYGIKRFLDDWNQVLTEGSR